MQQQASTQASQVQAPPIPKMEAGTPGAPTRRQIAEQARASARAAVAEARQAAQRARDAAQQAGAPVQAPSPPANIPPPATTTTAPQWNNPDDVPPNAMNLGIAFFVTMAICVIGLPLARALARALDRRSATFKSGASDVTPQLRQLQESVDALAIEMERISEGQRFTAKLLADRAAPERVGEKAG